MGPYLDARLGKLQMVNSSSSSGLWQTHGTLFACATAVLFFASIAIGAQAQSTTAGKRTMPLVSTVEEVVFLDNAKKTQAQADQLESQHDLYGAMMEFEKLIATSGQLSSALLHSYRYYMIIAASHLDAARTRIAYGAVYRGQRQAWEDNQGLIRNHLTAIPNFVVSAADVASKELASGTEREHFRADAYKLLAAGLFYRGILNSAPQDVNEAIRAYEQLAKTDPGSTAQAKRMISYLGGVRRQMENSALSYDNVVKLSSGIVKAAVPKWGTWLAPTLEIVAEYYKEHRSEPSPPRAR